MLYFNHQREYSHRALPANKLFSREVEATNAISATAEIRERRGTKKYNRLSPPITARAKKMIKELRQNFKKLTFNVEHSEDGKWYDVYNFNNQKDELILEPSARTITMVNLDYNGDDVWAVINYLRDNHDWKLI